MTLAILLLLSMLLVTWSGLIRSSWPLRLPAALDPAMSRILAHSDGLRFRFVDIAEIPPHIFEAYRNALPPGFEHMAFVAFPRTAGIRAFSRAPDGRMVLGWHYVGSGGWRLETATSMAGSLALVSAPAGQPDRYELTDRIWYNHVRVVTVEDLVVEHQNWLGMLRGHIPKIRPVTSPGVLREELIMFYSELDRVDGGRGRLLPA